MGKRSADYGSKLQNNKYAQHKRVFPLSGMVVLTSEAIGHDILTMGGRSGYVSSARAAHAELESTERNGSMSDDHQDQQRRQTTRISAVQCGHRASPESVFQRWRSTYSDGLRFPSS